MRKITKLNLLRTLRVTGAFSFIPEGHTYSPLVTQAVVSFPKVRLVRSPRGMRHLRKPMDNAAYLPKRHHCPRSCQSPFRFGSPSANCPNKPATGSFICGYDCPYADSHFLFCEREIEKWEREDGENEWRSTIWKRKSSAGEQGDPPVQHQHI